MPRSKKSGGKWAKPNRLAARETRLQPDFVPFAAASQPSGRQPAFSLQQEARNTSGHRDWWDQKLRNSKVNFISAGTDRPSAIDPDAMAKMTLEDQSTEVEDPDADGDEYRDIPITHNKDDMHTAITHSPTRQDDLDVGFIMDSVGAGPIDTGLPPPRVRSVSPTPTDSSEEVILFKGRNNMANGTTKEAPRRRSLTSSDALDRKIRIVEDKIHEKEEILESIHTQEPEYLSFNDQSRKRTRQTMTKRDSRGKASRAPIKEDEDALLADYIANMNDSEDEGDITVFKSRELGGSEVDVWVDESNESSAREIDHKKPTKKDLSDPGRHSSYSWDRNDINDLDDLPTSHEVFRSVQEILSKRERSAGTQYLVVWDDHMMDECRWVPKSTLDDISGASALIKAFEVEEKLAAEFEDNGVSDEDSEDDLADSDEDEDEDEEDFNGETMSDERIARLLAKQEELGMGSDRLMLFDDVADDEEDESRYIIREISKPSGRGTKRPRGDFPAASALADAYDGFDVMDRERPSLSSKKQKGRKGKGIYELELSDIDQDLALQLQLQFGKDREKKKLVKQEREELRAQGLLGKGKKGQPDMKAKYKEGITLSEIKEEIRDFLLSDNAQFALPPMEKAHRKLVHEIASAFNLKSTSYGSGKTRFPMLIRTNRTIDYNERLFQRLQDRLGRRFLPRMDVSKKNSGTPRQSGGGRGGGFNNSAVSYRDGEIVGGSAPELGIENKGRAMLEKMGWNKGDALGAVNNKGILLPVNHVVKTTKAGLG